MRTCANFLIVNRVCVGTREVHFLSGFLAVMVASQGPWYASRQVRHQCQRSFSSSVLSPVGRCLSAYWSLYRGYVLIFCSGSLLLPIVEFFCVGKQHAHV